MPPKPVSAKMPARLSASVAIGSSGTTIGPVQRKSLYRRQGRGLAG